MGYVEIQNDQVLVSTCRMQIFKFPFDTQMCNLSFKSVIYTGERAGAPWCSQRSCLNGVSLLFRTAAKDMRLLPGDNSTEATEWSRELMRTQYEWLFVNMTVTTKNATNLEDQDVIIYTVRTGQR